MNRLFSSKKIVVRKSYDIKIIKRLNNNDKTHGIIKIEKIKNELFIDSWFLRFRLSFGNQTKNKLNLKELPYRFKMANRDVRLF